ncbi:hypothetical protein OESDEN_21541 [Oesophagostomum dentatum]|uniref:Uncharacterized protein n=1 Tax=Oesophagostomum dentatum TaxID=61180 RepID=A0A0B1S0G0_OESDE|nr:hypothetical protein OESDEN_21541 [Oesophagostomum dentatum]
MFATFAPKADFIMSLCLSQKMMRISAKFPVFDEQDLQQNLAVSRLWISALVMSCLPAVGNAESARVMIVPSNIASLGADSGFRSASRSKPNENANAVPPLIRTPFANPCKGIEVILFGTRVKRFDGKGLNRPLGVKYDESLRQWIVADTLNNRVSSGSIVRCSLFSYDFSLFSYLFFFLSSVHRRLELHLPFKSNNEGKILHFLK